MKESKIVNWRNFVDKRFREREIDILTYEKRTEILNDISRTKVALEELARREDVPFFKEFGYTNKIKILCFDFSYPNLTGHYSDGEKITFMHRLMGFYGYQIK
jgi:hypothetical protein